MQIVPNWANVEGQVVGEEPSNRLPDFTVVYVRVEKVAPVDGFANLMQDCPGQVVAVLVRNDLAAGLDRSPGVRVRCLVRRTDPRTVFAHPRGFHTGDDTPTNWPEPSRS